MSYYYPYIGDVRYQAYTERDMAQRERLANISRYIRESQNTSFSGTWALLVEWSNVHPYDHQFFFNNPSFFEGETADFLNSVSKPTNTYTSRPNKI